MRRDAWLGFSLRRRLPVIRQATIAECGLACVAMVAARFGCRRDLAELRRRYGGSLQGATLGTVLHACESLELVPRAVRCSLSELARLRTPCILHWDFDHFVVLKKMTRRHLVLHDPARGRVRESLAAADRKFTGVALELAPTSRFRQAGPATRLRLGDLVVFDGALAGSLSLALLLAVICELFVLAMPLYLQTVIDQVLMRGDRLLLDALALGFGLLALFLAFANGLRQLTFQYLAQTTVFTLSSRVLRHLLRLPLRYFRERELGDVQQRLQMLGRVQAFVTHTAPRIAIDATFLLLVTVLMAAFEPRLTALAVGAAGAYLLWRSVIFPFVFELAGRIVRAEAAVQTHLLESLRAVQSIKLLAGEGRRREEWQARFAERINASIRGSNLQIADGAVHQALFQGMHVLVVYLLAREVLAGGMSIGAVSAFVAYTSMFVTRVGGVIGGLVEYRLLRVPLERLADIVFADAEPEADVGIGATSYTGSVVARGLEFRYGAADEPVIAEFDIDCGCGEFIAIRGRSGSGKSTLLRLLAGLEVPAAGRLLFDGRPAADWPAGTLRPHIGAVLAGDKLLAGSIADNIAAFDDGRQARRVRRAARLACIDADIEALPMRYATRIGDLGAALSTGQVQRLLLARALYRQPRLLLLDEFSSGLDEATERQVLRALQRLDATCIAATHSAAVLRAADRIIDLGG